MRLCVIVSFSASRESDKKLQPRTGFARGPKDLAVGKICPSQRQGQTDLLLTREFHPFIVY